VSKNTGHNWRTPFDDEYDRLVGLAAMAMIGAASKPELSKYSCAYAHQAIARRGGVVDDGRYLVRDVALAVYSDVTDRAAEIYLSERAANFRLKLCLRWRGKSPRPGAPRLIRWCRPFRSSTDLSEKTVSRYGGLSRLASLRYLTRTLCIAGPVRAERRAARGAEA
jgi:hypothetical protein